jgi:hypothetical protein
MSGAALFNLAQTALTSDAGNISSSSSRDGLARAASMPLQRQRNNGAAKPPLEWRRFLTVDLRRPVQDLRGAARHRDGLRGNQPVCRVHPIILHYVISRR